MYVLHDVSPSKDSNAQESISMTIYTNTTIPPTVLYILQHSITKLKYFGKTTQDIRKYKGSGKRWQHHLRVHGTKHVVIRYVSNPYTDSIAISERATAFSIRHNIGKNKKYANLIPENGLDGGSNKGIPRSTESIKKGVESRRGYVPSDDHKQKTSTSLTGVSHSAARCKKNSDVRIGIKRGDPTERKVYRLDLTEKKVYLTESNKILLDLVESNKILLQKLNVHIAV
jgi:hypothetical protein